MNLIKNFLAKFNTLTPPDDVLKRVVADAVTSIGVKVSKDKVQIQNGVAYINVSNIAKNKIRLERGSVLNYLFETLPKSRDTIRDVR